MEKHMRSFKAGLKLFRVLKKIHSMSESEILMQKKVGLKNLLEFSLKHHLEVREVGVLHPSGYAFLMAKTEVVGTDDIYAVFRNFSQVDGNEVSIVKEWHSYSSGDAMVILDQFITGEIVLQCNEVIGSSHTCDFLSNYVGEDDINGDYYSYSNIRPRFESFVSAIEHPDYIPST